MIWVRSHRTCLWDVSRDLNVIKGKGNSRLYRYWLCQKIFRCLDTKSDHDMRCGICVLDFGDVLPDADLWFYASPKTTTKNGGWFP